VATACSKTLSQESSIRRLDCGQRLEANYSQWSLRLNVHISARTEIALPGRNSAAGPSDPYGCLGNSGIWIVHRWHRPHSIVYRRCLQAFVSVKCLRVNDRALLRKIGRVVRERRLALNFTQECLAELLGVHWQTISAIERGVYPVSLLVFARLCQHLEIGPEKLLEGIPTPDVRRTVQIKKALARKRRPAGG